MEFETTPASMLDRDGEGWSFYQRSLELFGGDEIIVAAFRGSHSYDLRVLDHIDSLSRRFQELSGVRRVDSLSVSPIVRVNAGGELDLSPAMEAPPATPVAAAGLRSTVEQDRIAPRVLVSEDGSVFAVNVVLDDGALDQEAIVSAVRDGAKAAGGRVSGVPVFESEVGPRTLREILLFVPFTIGLIGLVLFVVFRSWWAACIPLVSSALPTWLLLGVMGFAREPVTLTGMILPSVLLALGSAYVMHVLAAGRGLASRDSLLTGISDVAMPVALSGVTTAVGFAAMAAVDIEAIRSLGLFGSVGVLLATLSGISAAPAMLSLRPVARRQVALDRWVRFTLSEKLVSIASRRGRRVVLVWALALGVSGVGLGSLEVETDATRWWRPGSDVRDDYELIRADLSGISPMNVVLSAAGSRAVTDGEVLEAIDALSTHLESLPEVGRAISVADPLRQINGEMLGDESRPLPAEEDLVEQYLLLLESVETIDDVISADRMSANVILRVDENGSRRLMEVAAEAERWWAAHGPEDVAARTTGIMFEFARSEEAITWGQITGLGFAVVAIALILAAALGSASVALLSLLPNIMPIAIVFGALGLFRVPLDGGTACMASLALGIAVDDTVHVVTAYQARRRRSEAPVAALGVSLQAVLPALIFTTIAISIGFSVLALSEFMLTRSLGAVTASLVTLCLLADTTLLPAILLRFHTADVGPPDVGS